MQINTRALYEVLVNEQDERIVESLRNMVIHYSPSPPLPCETGPKGPRG